MSMYYGTRGWLYSSRGWGEADRLLSFYTEDLGRVDAVAKGVRRGQSKLRGHLTLFSLSRIIVTQGKDYWRLIDAESILTPVSESISYVHDFGSFFARLVTGTLEPNRDLWDTVWGGAYPTHDRAVAILKLHTLQALGFLPDREGLAAFFPEGIAESAFNADAFNRGVEKILALNHMI